MVEHFVSALLPTLAPTFQGEIFIIDEGNTFYYLHCGNLCGDNDDATTPILDDDRTTTYEYIGCYGDQSDRILSGLSLPNYDGITTEVRRGSQGPKCVPIRHQIPLVILGLEYMEA